MIITYRNFSTSSFVITSWWSLHTATFPLFPLLSLHDDHYIPQLFPFLLCCNIMMMITTATFAVLPFLSLYDDHYIPQHFSLRRWLSLLDDHYVPQRFHFLLCYNFMMIITYHNFSTSSFVITSWWSLRTATFSLPPLL